MGGIRRLLILCTVASTVLAAPAARFAMASGRTPRSGAGTSRGAPAAIPVHQVAVASRSAQAVEHPATLATGSSGGNASTRSSDDSNDPDPPACEKDGDTDHDEVTSDAPCDDDTNPTVCANDGDHDADDAAGDEEGANVTDGPCMPPCDRGGLAGAGTETVADQLWDGGLNQAAPLLHEPEANGPLSSALDQNLQPLNPIGHEAACAVSLVDGK